MDNKAKGGIAAVIGALLYGGAQILEMESRIGNLEELHPEIVTGVPMDPHAPQEPQSPQEPAEATQSPEPTEEVNAGPESAPEPAEAIEEDPTEAGPIEE